MSDINLHKRNFIPSWVEGVNEVKFGFKVFLSGIYFLIKFVVQDVSKTSIK